MTSAQTRDWAFTALLLVLTALLAWRMWPPRVTPVLTLEIVANAVPIQRLDQPRSPRARKRIHVDRLDLAHDGRLAHPRLGALGYTEPFFVDLETAVEIVAGGDYRFIVASVDGFELSIAGQRLCSHSGRRSVTTETCQTRLGRGRHVLKLRHFQAGEEGGLSVRYQRQGERNVHWLGQDSRHVRFWR